MAQSSWERSSGTSGLIALGGAAAMVAGSFLPWFGTAVGSETVSGWDLFDSQRDLGDNPFMVDEMFKSGFNPFFTGATTLLLGVVLGVLAGVVLLVPKQAPAQRFKVAPGLYAAMVVTGSVAVVAAAIDVMTIAGRPEELRVSIEFGFWLTVAAVIAASVGLLRAGSASPGERSRAPLGQEAAPGRAVAPGGAPVPGWYTDPVARHQARYWDGQAWTPHVADAGSPSEDPVGVT